MMFALKVTVIFSVLNGQVLTLAIPDQACIINIENTCPGGYCCVHDDFLLGTYCKLFGQAQAPCSTKPSDFECPCALGLRCASDVEGHITSLFGRCYVIPGNTTAAPSTITTPTTTTSTMSAQLWTTTTVLTTSYLTTGTTELLTTSVSTISQIVTNILSTTLRLKRKTVVTGSLAPQTDPNSSAATGSEAVTQKANVYDSTSNPQNMIVPIG